MYRYYQYELRRSNLHCFRPGIEFIRLNNHYRKSSLLSRVDPMRLPDIFLSSEVGTFYRVFLVASVRMISNFSGRSGQSSDWTPVLVRKSYYKLSEFKFS